MREEKKEREGAKKMEEWGVEGGEGNRTKKGKVRGEEREGR